MKVSSKIIEFLEIENVKYEILQHPRAITSLETAAAQHVPGRRMIKSVILKADGKFVMCVLAATQRLDFDKLRKVLQATEVKLATEAEMAKLFTEYEVGAEPPFGGLFGLPLYADKFIKEDDEVVFNAGTHTELFRIKGTDYLRIANPHLVDIC